MEQLVRLSIQPATPPRLSIVSQIFYLAWGIRLFKSRLQDQRVIPPSLLVLESLSERNFRL